MCYTFSHLSSNLSLNREDSWGTTNDFATSFLHFSLFSTALWDLAYSRPVKSLMLSSHTFFCLPCLLPSFTVPCKMVLDRLDEWETCPYHCCLRLSAMVRKSSCGPIACWILAQTSSLVTCSLYELRSILPYLTSWLSYPSCLSYPAVLSYPNVQLTALCFPIVAVGCGGGCRRARCGW